ARGNVKELGRGTDIYSLGATLYNLLTGQAPIEGNDQNEMLQKAMVGQVRAPSEVSNHVPPPLEAICRKAMAPLPDDRYTHARELAEDVERWLADQPVSCYRESLPEKTARWSRAHSSAVFATTAASLFIAIFSIAAAAIINGYLQRAEAAEKAAIASEKEAQKATLIASDLGNDALVALRDFHMDLGVRAERIHPVLEQIRKRQADLESDDPDAIASQAFRKNVLAELYGSTSLPLALEQVQSAKDDYRRLLERSPDRLDCQLGLARSTQLQGQVLRLQGKVRDGLTTSKTALNLYQDLISADTPSLDAMRGWLNTLIDLQMGHSLLGEGAMSRDYREQYSKAVERIAKTFPDFLNNHYLQFHQRELQADSDWSNNKIPQALEIYSNCINEYRKLMEQAPDVVKYRIAWARTLTSRAQTWTWMEGVSQEKIHKERERDLQDASSLLKYERLTKPTHPQVMTQFVATSDEQLSTLKPEDLARRTLIEERCTIQKEIVSDLKKLAQNDPSHMGWKLHTSQQVLKLANLLIALSDTDPDSKDSLLDEATQIAKESELLTQDLKTTFGSTPYVNNAIIQVQDLQKVIRQRKGVKFTPDEKIKQALENVRLAEKAVEQDPQNQLFRQNLGLMFTEAGRVFKSAGQIDQAIEYGEKSLAVFRELQREQPPNTWWLDLEDPVLIFLASSLFDRSLTAATKNLSNRDLERNRKTWKEWIALRKKLVEHYPQSLKRASALADAYVNLADDYYRSIAPQEAEDYWNHHLDVLQKVSERTGHNDPFHPDWTRALYSLVAENQNQNIRKESISTKLNLFRGTVLSAQFQSDRISVGWVAYESMYLIRYTSTEKDQNPAEKELLLRRGLSALRWLEKENRIHPVQK
ncbi:MAG: hypothetical protein KDA84_21230, partial [Planctomycetaceae bacterium]|nr:hypothetical protein [Planctomycetaceae bacterium]